MLNKQLNDKCKLLIEQTVRYTYHILIVENMMVPVFLSLLALLCSRTGFRVLRLSEFWV